MTLVDYIPCDACGDETTDPSRCDHGEDLCGDCRDEGGCHLCDVEAADTELAESANDAMRERWCWDD